MKILRVFMAVCILLGVAAPVLAQANDADIVIEVTDVEKNIITVSGEAPNDIFVTVMVLNPGFSAANIDFNGQTSDKAALQYFGYAKSQGGSFKKEIEINTQSGGTFTVCVAIDGIKTEKTFQFFSYAAKSAYVDILKGAPTASELPEIINTYSLSSHPLYDGSQLSSVAALIPKMNKGRALENPTDAAEFLLEVLLVNAYNSDNENAFKNGKMAYTDVLKIENEPWYKEYSSSLSNEGYASVKAGLFGGEYTSLSGIKDKLVQLVKYHAIMNNKNYGGDHIEYFMDTYEAEYEALGFNIDAYKKSDKKKAIFLQLVSSGASNINTLAEKFNELFEEKEGEKLPETTVPSGGGGGGGGGAKPTPTPTPTVTPTPTAAPSPSASPASYPFDDMEEALWAKDAVLALYEKGIVKGRSEEEFAPSQNVTRAEFVKLIVEALNFSDIAEENFADVSENDWFYEYIKKACHAEIIKGANGNFLPNGNITREDAAVILARALKLDMSGQSNFADENQISDYAKGAVAILSEKGIISGVGNNLFAPKDNLTRAQAAVLIYNVLGGAN